MLSQSSIQAACYVRVSTENQLENYSIDEQIERLEAYCKARGWKIYKIYTDGGFSGGNTNRPALRQMLQAIHEKKINLVVVYKLDRLSRSQKDTLTLIEDEFIKNNVDFVSINENFDTSTPFGRAMIGILSVFAQLEKDQITERFTMGRIARTKAGYYHGGSTAPTGYKYVDGLLIIDEAKAPQIREVFERFVKGYSINSIYQYMEKKYGWGNSHTHMLYILRNSVYIGKVKFKGKEYDGLHDPIISEGVFWKAQALLNSKDRENKKSSSQKTPFRAGYILSSLIHCKKCGAKYSAVKGFYRCYSRSKCDQKYIVDPNCKNKNWEINELDTLVIDEIKYLILSPNRVDRLWENRKPEKPAENKDAIRTRIHEIDSQISRMIELYQISGIPIEQVAQKIQTLQNERNSLEGFLVPQKQLREQNKNDFINRLKKFDEGFSLKTVEERRMLIRNVIQSVNIDNENVEIEWGI